MEILGADRRVFGFAETGEHFQDFVFPPVSEKRLFLTPRGGIGYSLKTPYRDGTTHVIFEPLDFIARLTALVPPPRLNPGSSPGQP